MSWLDDVLAGRRAPGLFSWSSPRDVSDLRRAAEEAGWGFVHLDTSTAADKAGFLGTAARAFDFPDWFGHNWDALDECLADLPSERGTLVLWEGSTGLDADVVATARDILRDRAGSLSGGPLVVLVRPGA